MLLACQSGYRITRVEGKFVRQANELSGSLTLLTNFDVPEARMKPTCRVEPWTDCYTLAIRHHGPSCGLFGFARAPSSAATFGKPSAVLSNARLLTAWSCGLVCHCITRSWS